mgnify:CR=1 FL=1
MLLDLVSEHMDDLFWLCETIASGCVSRGWKPTSSQEKKCHFLQAVGVSDLAFTITFKLRHALADRMAGTLCGSYNSALLVWIVNCLLLSTVH